MLSYRRLLAALVIVCFSAQSHPLYADAPFKVARGDDNYAPYEFHNEQDELSGFHIDLIEQAAQRLGLNTAFVSTPWTRALAITRRGDTQAISYASYTTARVKDFIFLEGNRISVANQYLITRADLSPPLEFDTLTERENLSLGLVRGFAYGENLKRLTHSRRYLVPNESQLLPFLIAGRVDAIVLNNYRLQKLLAVKPLTAPLRVVEPALIRADIYLAFSRIGSSLEQACQFAQAMEALKRNGTTAALMRKHQIPSSYAADQTSTAPCRELSD